MIADSAPWKDELLKDADLIERWAAKARPSERGSILIERKVFVSAFAMRKLIECEKVSSDVEGRSLHRKVRLAARSEAGLVEAPHVLRSARSGGSLDLLIKRR
ncbi:hypothetical protein ABID21_001154 [Pseudorhizobium tarimense]|uniref:Uncharacterized protein n=1 Tax=Pseudorhizobium tarimense TaxID=1079109 RepID=A0ABV2H459_9HYPH|nr:hypothetical protein [Pseudorhizobium tarimense]MCJ8518522.1 hypothetical protein [Pseudorhizobium tarimense]